MQLPPLGIAPGLPAPQAGVLLLYYSGCTAFTGTRTRLLSLEGINTTLVLWTHDKGGRHVHGSATGANDAANKKPKATTTSAGFEPTRAEPIRFRV